MDAIQQAVKESVKNEVDQLPPTLTAEDIKNYLNVGWNKTYELLRRNDNPIPHRRIGRQYRINRVQFIQWLYEKDSEEVKV